MLHITEVNEKYLDGKYDQVLGKNKYKVKEDTEQDMPTNEPAVGWHINWQFFYDPKVKSLTIEEWVENGGIIPEPQLSENYSHLRDQVEINIAQEELWRKTHHSK